MLVSAQSPLLQANVVNVEAAQEGNTRAAHIRATGYSVQRVSRPVWVRSNCYAKTNLYIKNSHVLVKVNGQLYTFWYVVGLREVFFVCCILGILAFLHISVTIIFLGCWANLAPSVHSASVCNWQHNDLCNETACC